MLPLALIGHEGCRLLVVLNGGWLLRDLIGGAAVLLPIEGRITAILLRVVV